MTRPTHFKLSIRLPNRGDAINLLKYLAEHERYDYQVKKHYWDNELDCSVTVVEVDSCWTGNLEELAVWMQKNINDSTTDEGDSE
jgi:hypothetical protein